MPPKAPLPPPNVPQKKTNPIAAAEGSSNNRPPPPATAPPPQSATPNTNQEQPTCKHCSKSFSDVAAHEPKCALRKVKCQKCGEAVVAKDAVVHRDSCQGTGAPSSPASSATVQPSTPSPTAPVEAGTHKKGVPPPNRPPASAPRPPPPTATKNETEIKKPVAPPPPATKEPAATKAEQQSPSKMIDGIPITQTQVFDPVEEKETPTSNSPAQSPPANKAPSVTPSPSSPPNSPKKAPPPPSAVKKTGENLISQQTSPSSPPPSPPAQKTQAKAAPALQVVDDDDDELFHSSRESLSPPKKIVPPPKKAPAKATQPQPASPSVTQEKTEQTNEEKNTSPSSKEESSNVSSGVEKVKQVLGFGQNEQQRSESPHEKEEKHEQEYIDDAQRVLALRESPVDNTASTNKKKAGAKKGEMDFSFEPMEDIVEKNRRKEELLYRRRISEQKYHPQHPLRGKALDRLAMPKNKAGVAEAKTKKQSSGAATDGVISSEDPPIYVSVGAGRPAKGAPAQSTEEQQKAATHKKVIAPTNDHYFLLLYSPGREDEIAIDKKTILMSLVEELHLPTGGYWSYRGLPVHTHATPITLGLRQGHDRISILKYISPIEQEEQIERENFVVEQVLSWANMQAALFSALTSSRRIPMHSFVDASHDHESIADIQRKRMALRPRENVVTSSPHSSNFQQLSSSPTVPPKAVVSKDIYNDPMFSYFYNGNEPPLEKQYPQHTPSIATASSPMRNKKVNTTAAPVPMLASYNNPGEWREEPAAFDDGEQDTFVEVNDDYPFNVQTRGSYPEQYVQPSGHSPMYEMQPRTMYQPNEWYDQPGVPPADDDDPAEFLSVERYDHE